MCIDKHFEEYVTHESPSLVLRQAHQLVDGSSVHHDEVQAIMLANLFLTTKTKCKMRQLKRNSAVQL